MSELISDIDELFQNVLVSNCCLADMIHDGSKADEPELASWKEKYDIMERLAGNLRDRKRELEDCSGSKEGAGMTDTKRLTEIGARCERATEGPWTAQEFPCMDYYSVTGPDGLFVEEVVCHDRTEESIIVREPDAKFIAHAREDVPWLLAEVKRLTSEVETEGGGE